MTTRQVSLVTPKGRTAAEKRLGAIAALHQPIPDRYLPGRAVCGECGDGRYGEAPWPCATARLLGVWPGESDE